MDYLLETLKIVTKEKLTKEDIETLRKIVKDTLELMIECSKGNKICTAWEYITIPAPICFLVHLLIITRVCGKTPVEVLRDAILSLTFELARRK